MTDPMQELERLRKELNYYKKLLAIMPGHIYWLDRNNVFLGSNIGHAKTAGLESPEQFIGTTPYDHTSSDYAQAVCEINERIMATGHEQVLEEVAHFGMAKNALISRINCPLRMMTVRSLVYWVFL